MAMPRPNVSPATINDQRSKYISVDFSPMVDVALYKSSMAAGIVSRSSSVKAARCPVDQLMLL